MVRQLSYTKYENEILPEFRQKLNQAESTEDVKKFFTQTIRILFEKILERKVVLSNEDMTLIIDKEPHYKIARQFKSSEELNALLKDSDLSNVLNRDYQRQETVLQGGLTDYFLGKEKSMKSCWMKLRRFYLHLIWE